MAAGADACYFGCNEGLNARARAENFDIDELGEVMRFLHERGVHGYLCMNILVFDTELSAAEDLVRRACEFAEQWVAEGRGRLIVEQDLIETLDATNQREGQQLADAMFSPAFWRANGVPGWLARPLSPVLRQLAKL